MRLLHTSDWHLGHSFCDHTRAREQAAFLDWLLQTISAHEVDVLVVAGDIFDSPAAPNEAFELYYRFFAKLAALDAPTRSGARRTAVVVGGNHDSPGRLDAPRDILSTLATHVVGGYDAARISSELADPTGQLIPVPGSEDHIGLVIAAVPFLNDWKIGVRGFDASVDEQRASMHERFRDVYARLADKANARYPGVPLVATGHLTCLPKAGQKTNEDDAVPAEINRVGTLGAMEPGIFDPRFSYVALGHIHRGFAADGNGRVHYSGSPVQIGVTESPASRRVLLVDIDGAQRRSQSIAVPTTRRLIAIRGSLEEVQSQLETLAVPEGELEPYVTVRVTLTAPQPRAAELVREAAKRNRSCMPLVVDIQAALDRASAGTPLVAGTGVHQVTPEEAFRFAWHAKYGTGSSPSSAVLQRFQSLLEGPPGPAR